MVFTSYRSLKQSDTKFTISAVAPFLTGLQFITNAFIFSAPPILVAFRVFAPITAEFELNHEYYLLHNQRMHFQVFVCPLDYNSIHPFLLL